MRVVLNIELYFIEEVLTVDRFNTCSRLKETKFFFKQITSSCVKVVCC